MGKALLLYLCVSALMSLVTAVLIVWDKRQARRNRWRVSERTLHLCEWLGGWPGSWLARRAVRHKTHKRSYRRAYACVVAVHVLLLVVCVWWWFNY